MNKATPPFEKSHKPSLKMDDIHSNGTFFPPKF